MFSEKWAESEEINNLPLSYTASNMNSDSSASKAMFFVHYQYISQTFPQKLLKANNKSILLPHQNVFSESNQNNSSSSPIFLQTHEISALYYNISMYVLI